MVNCYAEYTKAAEDLVGAKEFFAESSGAGGDAEMKEMAREEVCAFFFFFLLDKFPKKNRFLSVGGRHSVARLVCIST